VRSRRWRYVVRAARVEGMQQDQPGLVELRMTDAEDARNEVTVGVGQGKGFAHAEAGAGQ
jgi:hypothetical protein